MFDLFIDGILVFTGSRRLVLSKAFDFVYGSCCPYEARSRVTIKFHERKDVI